MERETYPGTTGTVTGRGRAGTMLMAYLIDEKQLSPAQAQAALSAVRPHVSPRLWKRPSVREFHRRMQQRALLQQQAMQAQQMQQQQASSPGPQLGGGGAQLPRQPPPAPGKGFS